MVWPLPIGSGISSYAEALLSFGDELVSRHTTHRLHDTVVEPSLLEAVYEPAPGILQGLTPFDAVTIAQALSLHNDELSLHVVSMGCVVPTPGSLTGRMGQC